MAETNLTTELFREYFNYEPDTGILRWRINKRRARAGAVAGCECKSRGYLVVKINGCMYRVHRVIWVYVHGVEPLGQIDHIDGDKSNNKLVNLRDVSPSVNRQNQRKPNSNNKSGLLGVTWHARSKKWIANLRKPGAKRATELGRFHSPGEAHDAYIAAKRLFHTGCTI